MSDTAAQAWFIAGAGVIATYDFGLVTSIDAIRPLVITVSAAYLAISLRFFFYGPVIITATATACFVIATALSA